MIWTKALLETEGAGSKRVERESTVNSQLAKEFREHWQTVAAIEPKEQRSASIALRWQQANTILRLAMGLG